MKFGYYLTLIVLVLAVSCAGFASAGNQGIDQAALKDLPPESAEILSLNIAAVLHAFSFDNENETWSAYNYGERTGIITMADGSVLFTNPHGSFGMHLDGLGRDDAIMPVDKGTLMADGRKVEIVRSESSEWYINKDEGIEQGMTITKRPEGTGSLRVMFDLSGTLVPVPDGQDVVLSDQYGPVLRYSGLKAVDATGRELPAVLNFAGTRLSWEIDDGDAVYPLLIDPTITEDKILSASDKADYDYFGRSVAVSGDTVVVGAYGAGSGGLQRGQAYVFSRNQGGTNTWGPVKILSAWDKADYDWFGYSVAVSGDTVVVGAPDANSGGTERGQAYVFSRNQGGTNNWGLVMTLSASDKADYDWFGSSVAVSGDTVVVGAFFADSGGLNNGKAYVFSRNQWGPNNWGEMKILSASDKADNDQFGYSVAVSGDTVVVGAYLANSGGTDRGQAYVFSRNKGGLYNWGQEKILSASDQVGWDYFGYSVAVDGDTIVVGAVRADSGDANRGQAYVFSRNQWGTNFWGEVKILSASDQADKDYFGDSVAVSGDTVIVGANDADSGGTYRRGQAYVFIRNQGGINNWGQEKILSASDKADGDQFGYSVAVDGDTVVVGARYKASGGTQRGQAYVFPTAIPSKIGVFRPSSHMFYLKNGTTTTSINWGTSTDKPVTGDWNGDGRTEVGVFRNPTHMFYLKNGTTTTTINWGVNTDLPVTGDWNGDGRTEVGVFRPSVHTFYLKNGTTTTSINWGVSTDLPVTGDWNGDDRTEVGVFRNPTHTFYLKNGTTTTSVNWGISTDLPVTGDWNGDGRTDVGVYRPSAHTFYLKNGTTTTAINWGVSTDLPVTGKW
jgi:hypothetical protein